ncbi:ANTAR domain-containing protein [Amycolatopsis palatopharyngis]|uniref:ANTAR domain-containing protein n=1 Tax=Amycolatopsis palatopharyngis TaxID=187982 RepID=UPI000E25021A|nr:ANTAR domain-containing protein [Amycolatopsis palatopharyngis]
MVSAHKERDLRRSSRLAEQTLTALNDRVLVSHAVGLVAGTLDTDQHRARAALSDYALRQRRPLPEVARAVTEGKLDPSALGSPSNAEAD